MKELVERIQALVDVPLCIDSSVPGALKTGLETAHGRPLLNSVTGEEERMELVLPLVKKYNVPVVAISNDDTGISENPDVRFAVAKKIVERAADFGIPAHDIVVDPLVMPVGAMATAGLQVFALVRRLRDELGVNTTCGASNISFGLPNRHGINNAFLPMAAAAGMTSAIMNPYQAGASDRAIAERVAELEAIGVTVPGDVDPAVLAPLIGLGPRRRLALQGDPGDQGGGLPDEQRPVGCRLDPLQQAGGRRARGRPCARGPPPPPGINPACRGPHLLRLPAAVPIREATRSSPGLRRCQAGRPVASVPRAGSVRRAPARRIGNFT